MTTHWLAIAASTFVSEDLTCIATGVLIAQGQLGFYEGTVACLAGIVAGDLLLYLAGRVGGEPLLRRPAVARFVSTEQLDRAAAWLKEKGMVVVLLSRFTPGLRLPTYVAAGLLSADLARFALYFLIAAAVWTPLLVGGAVLFGGQFLQTVFERAGHSVVVFGAAFAGSVGLYKVLRHLLSFPVRRRIVGFLKRKVRWEFWPSWAVYAPLLPYLLFLAWRHRSLTLFTAANPGIPSGGFSGESKAAILSHLSRIGNVVPDYTLIPCRISVGDRIDLAHRFMDESGLEYPVVLKPDVGERGAGVAIVRTALELQNYLVETGQDTILQRYVAGEEFGVFYSRHPHEPQGRILSITEKRFPVLQGDGESTLERLILRDGRAVCLAGKYLQNARRAVDAVPAAGEVVQLVEVGSHSRGSVFVDARHLNTPALERAIDRLSRAHPGFYFGRFDIRVPSRSALQAGVSLSVLELNGVTAEATHIYDPAVSFVDAYRALAQQWRIAFEIGASNRVSGAVPMTLVEFGNLIRSRFAACL